MPYMDGFELCKKILELDVNVRVCFMTAGEVNHEAIREILPSINIGCFIKKPVTIDDLIKRIRAELDQNVIREENTDNGYDRESTCTEHI